jgi:hypothetical protein
MDEWMRRGPLRPWVEAALSPDAPSHELLDAGAVGDVIGAWRGGKLSWSRAWAIVSLDGWLRALDLDGISVDVTAENQRLLVD